MSLKKTFLSIAAFVFATGPLLADAPNCQRTPPLQPGSLRFWPLHERLTGPDVDDAPGAARTGLMNNFGEFQHYPASDPIRYIHTGIDIRGLWFDAPTNEGDLVLAVESGDLWAAPNFTGDTCTDSSDCRIFVKSNDRRHIYYYAHLNVRSHMDSHVRQQIENATMVDPDDDLPVGANPISAGQVLAGLGIFSSGFTHLHFSIFDVCENYDGLNPLIYLPNPDFEGQPYVDETGPTIGPVLFVEEDGVTGVEAQGCNAPLTGPVDIMVEAKDAFHDLTQSNPKFGATHSNSVYKAKYRIRRVPAGAPEDHDWYKFDRSPYRCRGPVRGAACADPDPANSALLTQTDFIETVAEFPPIGNGGPSLGVTFADVLFNNVLGPFDSNSFFDLNERYFHILTHGWGFDDQPGVWNTPAYPDGLYQVSAEVADQAGNKAASHKFVVLDNHQGASPMGDLMIRDNPDDVGAIPSTLGGKKFWISPDIKVLSAIDPAPGVNDAIWSTVQDVHLTQGASYKVWVRVKNSGCETIHNVRARVAWANPASFQEDWDEIDTETGAGLSLAPGEAAVLGPFDWTPTEEQVGHRCLLSITRADGDPATIANFNEVINGQTVADDNNIGQLNLQIHATSKFEIVSPNTRKVQLHFDCNDFPLHERRALAELITPNLPALAAAWTGVPRTELRTVGRDLVLRFKGCKVDLPEVTLPAGTRIPASVHLELGEGPAGTYRVDLGQTVNDVLMGGMSFTIERQ